jgi:hypothetical protein
MKGTASIAAMFLCACACEAAGFESSRTESAWPCVREAAESVSVFDQAAEYPLE